MNKKRKLNEEPIIKRKIKRKQLSIGPDLNVNGDSSFANLPHEILLTIFKFLNIHEICKVAR
jgi:hypothetical protein